jgi:hypothetical protein
MRFIKNIKIGILLLVLVLFVYACGNNSQTEKSYKTMVYKGLYSFGPEMKTFTNCDENREYWVLDSAKTLELAYHNLGFEKPYEPVYIEVECFLKKSDTATVSGGYDSTMVVTKMLKISKEIPEDSPCSP